MTHHQVRGGIKSGKTHSQHYKYKKLDSRKSTHLQERTFIERKLREQYKVNPF